MLSLLQKLGEGFRHLCMYRCTVRIPGPLSFKRYIAPTSLHHCINGLLSVAWHPLI